MQALVVWKPRPLLAADSRPPRGAGGRWWGSSEKRWGNAWTSAFESQRPLSGCTCSFGQESPGGNWPRPAFSGSSPHVRPVLTSVSFTFSRMNALLPCAKHLLAQPPLAFSHSIPLAIPPDPPGAGLLWAFHRGGKEAPGGSDSRAN